MNHAITLRKTTLALAVAGALAFPVLAFAAPGDPVGGEFRVNTTTAGNQRNSDVAMDADGDFVVAWSGNGAGDSSGIFAQRYNSTGVRQGGEFRVNTTTANDQFQSVVAMDADGGFVVAWTSPDGSEYGIFAQRYNNVGVPQGGEFRINTFTADNQTFPAVAMDADGDFVVTWGSYGQDGSRQGVFAQRYNSASVPQGGEFRVNTTTVDRQDIPAVAMDADGGFVVTWDGNGVGDNRFGVFAQRYNAAGVPQGGEFRVNTTTVDVQVSSAVALDADGDFVVTWQSTSQDANDFGYGIFAQRYNNAGVRQGGEFQVNTFTADLQFLPAIATDADGDFVVTWNSYPGQDGDRTGVFAQRYNNTGVRQGGEFQVNTTTAGSQGNPVVAMDADGDFVVAWIGNGVGGFDIFAQRYTGGSGPATTCGGLPATLVGTPGNDTLTGTSGPDVIVGLAGNDTINGLGGNDIFCGGPGNDTMIGGGGSDVANFAGPLGVVVNLVAGTATGQGSDSLSGIANVTGSSAADSLTGNAGNNVLSGGLGNDTLDGAGGNDTASFAAASAAVNADLGTGIATGQGSDTLLNLENLTGSSGNDVLTGNGGNNILKGANGNDIMNGGAGTDTCNGQGGAGDSATACETVTGVP